MIDRSNDRRSQTEPACRRSLPRLVATFLATSILSALTSCSGRPPAPSPPPIAATTAPPRTIADQFITTFWCGPPLNFFDDARAREIADAGFNLVGASCEGPVTPRLNNRALRIAGRHGLKMLIKDSSVSAAEPLRTGWQAKANTGDRDVPQTRKPRRHLPGRRTERSGDLPRHRGAAAPDSQRGARV